MPDFVLDALNQCLPSKEQEETVLYGPALPSPNTLLVPGSDAVGANHVHNHVGSRLPGSSGNEGYFVFRALNRQTTINVSVATPPRISYIVCNLLGGFRSGSASYVLNKDLFS